MVWTGGAEGRNCGVSIPLFSLWPLRSDGCSHVASSSRLRGEFCANQEIDSGRTNWQGQRVSQIP